MTQNSINIAIVQMTAVDSLAANLAQFELIFNSIKNQQSHQTEILAPSVISTSPDLICFPENCLFLRIKSSDPIEGFELSHSSFLWISEWAKRLGSCIHLGAVPLIIEGKLYNSSMWFGKDGSIQAGYQKIHLFDIALEGQAPIRESDVFARGQAPVIREFNGWRIGESICYDVRFSELYSYYAYNNVDLILIPSSFLVETGQAHWEVLLRARAIESQCFVVASAQVGVHRSLKHIGSERRTFGNSMIVDPWGAISLNLGNEEGVQIYTLHKKAIQKVKNQIPMPDHRRLNVDIKK